MLIFSLMIAVSSAVLIIINRYQNKKLMDHLNQMLDSAIDGTFSETVFDETRLSALESKLGSYLLAAQTSARNVAEERNNIKTLVADISHQTKTPISNILLYSELLNEGMTNLQEMPNEELVKYADSINEQAQKLSFLITSLVKLSRLETGIITVTPKNRDICSMVQKLCEQYEQAAKDRGLVLCFQKDEDAAEAIACFDEKWTMEAVGNIIDNAVKYTGSGSILLRVKSYEMFCCIEIADSGIGISEDEQAQIFSRFYRSDRVSQKQGVGIGLYLARKIIATQNGYIKVNSKLGKGSVFSVYLPVEK